MDVLRLQSGKKAKEGAFDTVHIEKQDVSNNFFRCLDNVLQKSNNIEKFIR